MSVLAVVFGASLVLAVLADLVNTLVTTSTSQWRWWPTRILYRGSWAVVSTLGAKIKDDGRRERVYRLFAPLSVLVMLLAWVAQQVIGFGFISWGIGGVSGIDGLMDSIYFSGVVFFTVGFGEVVPIEQVPRFLALIEAFAGVLTTALVVGYLPALYAAYSEREQKLLTLDDGSEERITPTNLVIARSPDGDPRELDAFFTEWEAWIAQVLETHTSHSMLVLFRSQHPGQSWITALGLVADAALNIELTKRGQGRSAYWALRRASRLLRDLTDGADLSEYRKTLDETYEGDNPQLREIYDQMKDHGFEMLPYDIAVLHSRDLRRTYDAQLEFLIDQLQAPRGFWGHEMGHRMHQRPLEVVVDQGSSSSAQ